MENTNFAGMYVSNEIRFDGIVEFIKTVAAAIRSHVVIMPFSTAVHNLQSPLSA